MRKSAENIDTLCGHFGAITVPRDHRELEVWRKAHKLALDIYSVTKSFPKDELYGLTSQLRRAAVAITTTWPREQRDDRQKNTFSFATSRGVRLPKLTPFFCLRRTCGSCHL